MRKMLSLFWRVIQRFKMAFEICLQRERGGAARAIISLCWHKAQIGIVDEMTNMYRTEKLIRAGYYKNAKMPVA